MNQQSQIERKALSIPQAAAMLSLSRSGIYRLLGEQKLKGIRIRGRRLILAASIDELLNGSERPAQQPRPQSWPRGAEIREAHNG
jgi:excisionase family DNA binding protein